jgi:outer membrane receptor for monomeric catechols
MSDFLLISRTLDSVVYAEVLQGSTSRPTASAAFNKKLTYPLLDTPRTVTTVTKEVLEDKQAMFVRDLALTTLAITH